MVDGGRRKVEAQFLRTAADASCGDCGPGCCCDGHSWLSPDSSARTAPSRSVASAAWEGGDRSGAPFDDVQGGWGSGGSAEVGLEGAGAESFAERSHRS